MFPTDVKPLTLTIKSAVATTGLSRTRIYQLISTSQIHTVKVGRRRLVLHESLREFLLSKRTFR
jgi:excisionase family DNA binding protein